MNWRPPDHNRREKVEKKSAKLLSDFQTQTDKKVMANQSHIVFLDKQQRKVVVIDIAVPRDGAREAGNLPEAKGRAGESLEGASNSSARGHKSTRGRDPHPREVDISVQKSALLGIAKILHRTLKLPGLW